MRKKAGGKSVPSEKKSASVQNLAADQSLTIDDFLPTRTIQSTTFL